MMVPVLPSRNQHIGHIVRESGVAVFSGTHPPQAEVVATHLPDWFRFATKEDLAQLGSRLIRWMVGIFVGSVTVVGGLLTVLVTVVN